MDTSQNKLFDSEFFYTSSPNKSKIENIDNILFSGENNSKSRSNFSNSVVYNNNNNNLVDTKDNNNQENHIFLQLYAATQLLTYFHNANLHAALNSQLYNNQNHFAQLNRTSCVNGATKDSLNDSLISTDISANVASTSFNKSHNSSSSLSVEKQAQNLSRKGKINFASISDLIN